MERGREGGRKREKEGKPYQETLVIILKVTRKQKYADNDLFHNNSVSLAVLFESREK
jgi:hypothetical protein